jgi:nucleoside 2-deoxyribosyltransferase
VDEMKIYVGHSTSMEFRENLYQPLKDSRIAEKHEIVLPHDSDQFFDSKRFLREECDLFIAEVSDASTGLGIELGWAEEFGLPVICVFREGSEPSGALKAVTKQVREYRYREELVKILEKSVREIE